MSSETTVWGEAVSEILRDGLLTKVLGARLGHWREQAVSSPFLTTPRLLEFDWVVHTPSSAPATAVVTLAVQQPERTTTAGAATTTTRHVDRVALEVDRETLGEMVRTFVGIRDQLAVMTNK